ncbi:hypothetical protein AX774_g3945 [Zancudomyces culisetae]|uniref:Uncharacterized protein n=1 Tax=Zancudomyces culisetae TaxID=1213189 RepID=A0A1R1PNN9_ZANCU|nr:hypothetical protein AX774_g3945 [Zancudomyces culisetae]|eukprot:OMH82574.1 hypothetical protein AX774_g3945 [Zancudomyces culisetae]
MRERQLRKRSRAGIRCMRTSERYKDNSYEYGEENGDEEDYYDSEEEDLEIDEGYLSMTTTSVTESEEEGDEYEGELNRSGSENGMRATGVGFITVSEKVFKAENQTGGED